MPNNDWMQFYGISVVEKCQCHHPAELRKETLISSLTYTCHRNQSVADGTTHVTAVMDVLENLLGVRLNRQDAKYSAQNELDEVGDCACDGNLPTAGRLTEAVAYTPRCASSLN